MATDPKGLHHADRIVLALHKLENAFLVAGLKRPVAVLLAPGEEKKLGALIQNHGALLVADTECRETSINRIVFRDAK